MSQCPTILIAEDNKTVCAAFKKAVEKTCPGYIVRTTDNLAEAKRIFLKGNTAAVITDNDYPIEPNNDQFFFVQSGMDLIKFIRGDSNNHTIPIVFTTAASNFLEKFDQLRLKLKKYSASPDAVAPCITHNDAGRYMVDDKLLALHKSNPDAAKQAAIFLQSQLPAQEVSAPVVKPDLRR